MHCAGSVSAERVDRGRWVESPQCDMHMVAAKLGCERVMVGTGWAISHTECIKHCFHLIGG